jgi:hypothetical protein
MKSSLAQWSSPPQPATWEGLGTAAYAGDIVRAFGRIRGVYAEGLNVVLGHAHFVAGDGDVVG